MLASLTSVVRISTLLIYQSQVGQHGILFQRLRMEQLTARGATDKSMSLEVTGKALEMGLCLNPAC
jgi:hypothetical protein